MDEPGPTVPATIMTDRRPQTVALLGLLLQLTAFGALLGLSLWSKSDAIEAAARFVLAGVPIWFTLFLVFKQVRRVGAEALETEELKRARDAGVSSAIFEAEGEALLIEQGRLQWMIRWLLPGVTVLVALYLLVGYAVLWGWSLETAFDQTVFQPTQNPTLMMWFVVAVGFLSFLYARYTVALARLPFWRLLGSGASFMAGNALACLGLVVALMAATSIEWAEPLLACVVRAASLLLGVEFTVNFVLDFYRPRAPEVIPRPSFESRLLGLITEPGGIAKSIADAVNYQFGFEVSSTWFYQLLQRWLFPIMVATAAVDLALTSVVVVDADEAAVVERLGRPLPPPHDVLSPGIHFKWPYPIDIVRRAPVGRVSELVIGEAAQKDDEDPNKAIVWTEAHDFVPELMLLVAAPKLAQLSAEERGRTDAAPGVADRARASEGGAVSLLMVSVPIEYRIKDIRKYLYRFKEPVKILEGIAYQYLSEYAAGVDVDELMGPGREAFNAELRDRLQQRLDEVGPPEDPGIGMEIVFVGIRGAHPPVQERVAEAFQGVIGAQIKMAATVHAAVGEAQRILTAVAGTEARAKLLDEAIQARDSLHRSPPEDAQALAEARQRVDDLLLGNPAKGLAPMSGQAAAIIANARGRAREWVGQEAAKLRAFGTEVAAYQAAPKLYVWRKFLETYEGLGHIRKFLIIGNPSEVLVEYETAEQGGLDRVLTEGVEKERKKSQ
jgi:regulator of protease activity HflC (stomatin/prohibitin superfamily)